MSSSQIIFLHPERDRARRTAASCTAYAILPDRSYNNNATGWLNPATIGVFAMLEPLTATTGCA
jgi:hypothetical protein